MFRTCSSTTLTMSTNNTRIPPKRVEVKAYRARDRGDDGWFRHDGTPDAASTSTTQTPQTPRSRQTQDSEKWFGHNTIPDETQSKIVNKKDQCKKNRDKIFGLEESWYTYEHSPEISSPFDGYKEETPSPENSPGRPNTKNFRKRDLNSNSNDWYRHEHTVVLDELNEGTYFFSTEDLSDITDASPKSVQLTDNGLSAAVASSHQEAKINCQRNRNGSTDDWFSHDHQQPTVGISSPAHTGTKRNRAEVRRTPNGRQESGNWFNHDANRHYQPPKPSPRGTSAIARELVYKSRSGDEMQKILCMDENAMLLSRTVDFKFVEPGSEKMLTK